MRVLVLLTLTPVASAGNWAAGGSALSYYVLRGGTDMWNDMIDRCQEFEDNGGAVRGINCIANGAFYLAGAAAAFGAGNAGIEYIANYGRTKLGTGLLFTLILAASMKYLGAACQDWSHIMFTTTLVAILLTLLFSRNQMVLRSPTAQKSRPALSHG